MVATRVLLTDGEAPATLAAARSLSRAGHDVTVLHHSRHAAAAASRHVRRSLRTPDPVADPDGFTDALLAVIARGRFDIFLPMTDTALLLADRVRDRLPPFLRAAIPADLEPLLDKRAVLARAAALGIPVLSAQNVPGAVKLPAVVKPGRSRVIEGGRVRSATAVVAGTPGDVEAAVRRLASEGFSSYVEPWVPGEGRGIFLLRHEGRVLARFAHRRIREASPLGGPSAVAESVAPDPQLLEWAEALAANLDAEGPMMAEFRGVPGDWVLLEANVRYWGTLALAIDSGADFPARHVEALSGLVRDRSGAYREGVRRRNLAFDLRRLARVLRGRPRGLDISWPPRFGSLFDAVFEQAGGMIRQADDPAPGRAHALHLIKKAFRHE